MLVNRAKMTTATTGTGTLTLGSAVDGYQTFADAGVSDADVVSYAIEDGTAWELGQGTYTASGTTLSRTVSESSNSGAAINLSGNAVVFVTALASDFGGGGSDPTLTTSSGASQSVDFSTSNKIHVATIDEDATLTFTNPASVAKLDLILDVGGSNYNLSAASYDNSSFTVGSRPYSIFFKPDGAKFYTLTDTGDSVRQFSMSTPWEMSSAVNDSITFSVASQTTVPRGLFFRADGTKMFVVGVDGSNISRVFQYSLSTAWDLSTASYDSVSFSVSTQTTAGTGLFFKPDGTKMYVSQQNGAAYQYTLSTSWSVSTASYDGVSFALNPPSPDNYGIFFKPDGTKLYGVSNGTDSIREWTLGTAWDLSTATSEGVFFSVSSQETIPLDVAFKSDGSKMYVIGLLTGVAYQYSTGVAYSVTLPANLEAPAIPTVIDEKTALTIVTYDGGTTYQAINVQGGIV